jgi:hypothetical protein
MIIATMLLKRSWLNKPDLLDVTPDSVPVIVNDYRLSALGG